MANCTWMMFKAIFTMNQGSMLKMGKKIFPLLTHIFRFSYWVNMLVHEKDFLCDNFSFPATTKWHSLWCNLVDLTNTYHLPIADIVIWLLSNHFCHSSLCCAISWSFPRWLPYTACWSVVFTRNISERFILSSENLKGSAVNTVLILFYTNLIICGQDFSHIFKASFPT